MLYLIPTPIGNLEDITMRACRLLCELDMILAEDTRVSGRLLKHVGSTVPMKSYHDHNEIRVAGDIISLLRDGKEIGLITDAGTPGIADPAFYLVREALRANIPVSALPGPTAFVPALVASGLPSERFIFENFLPPKSARRRRIFEELRGEKRTVIFYESPHRILKVLAEMAEILPDTPTVVVRELTKIYEEFLRGNPATILKHFENRTPKGECVVLFNASGITLEELGMSPACSDSD